MTNNERSTVIMGRAGARRPRVAAALGVLAACFGLARSACGQDRPFIQVESASGLPRGILRVESGATYLDQLYLPFGRVKIDELLLLDTGVSYGVADNVEVELRVPLLLHDITRDHWDAGDSTLSVKFQIPRLLDSTSMALRAGVRLPTTKDLYDLGINSMDFRADVLASWVGRRFELHLNSGFVIIDNPQAPRSQNDLFRYGVALVYNRSKVSPLIELSGRAGPGDPGADDVHNALVGARVRRRNFVFDLGISKGLNENSFCYGVTVGFAWQEPLR
ncbi:MAG: hypothetical protein AB1714_13215 [Acidobacteriota bacterium]